MASANSEIGDRADFPIICARCMGGGEHIKMMREVAGAACKRCDRPFSVYKWRAITPTGTVVRRTLVCQTCAKLAHVCQVCMLDLDFGLRAEDRDAGLAAAGASGTDDVLGAVAAAQEAVGINRTWAMARAETMAKEAGADAVDAAYAAVEPAEILKRLAERDEMVMIEGEGGDDESKNRGKKQKDICKFWLQGKCKRGASCPFRHEGVGGTEDKKRKRDREDDDKDDNVIEQKKQKQQDEASNNSNNDDSDDDDDYDPDDLFGVKYDSTDPKKI